MFAAPGLILLLLTDYFKPQEYVPFLEGVPLLHAFTLLTLVGFVVDLRLGFTRFVAAPQLGIAILFVTWSAATNLPNGTGLAVRTLFPLLIPFTLFLLLAHCVQTLRVLRWMVALVLAMGVSVAFIGTHQGFAQWGCHEVQYGGGQPRLVFDGRSCSPEDDSSCYADASPGVYYNCERVGLLGTQSIHGRVRFRGTMEDPNELALAVAIVVPIAFAFLDRRRTPFRVAVWIATISLAAFCAFFTRSRGGQVVFIVTLGVYFVRRFGARGLLAGALCALPVLFLGGRTTSDAAASTSERLECWAAGLNMFRHSPLLGVGLGQFTEHYYQTAHNSYLLSAAELGLPGTILWTAIVYLSVKIPASVLRASESVEGPVIPRPVISLSVAILAALVGLVSGMLFLSYAYKELLWIYLGLSAALYQVVRRHEPSFRVRFGLKDLALVSGVACLLLAATAMYTRLMVGY